MMPLACYLRAVWLGAAIATAVVLLGKFGALNAEQFALAYEPFVWACYRVPFFVVAHEQWIELAAALMALSRVWQDR